MSSSVAPNDSTVSHPLSARETDVLVRISSGMTNQEIAEDLFLSPNSVKTYIRTAYRKIGVTTRTHAVIWAIGRGLGRDDPSDEPAA